MTPQLTGEFDWNDQYDDDENFDGDPEAEALDSRTRKIMTMLKEWQAKEGEAHDELTSHIWWILICSLLMFGGGGTEHHFDHPALVAGIALIALAGFMALDVGHITGAIDAQHEMHHARDVINTFITHALQQQLINPQKANELFEKYNSKNQ